MEIECADCGCLVDAGIRIVPCDKSDCCCRHLPAREEPRSPLDAPGHRHDNGA